MSNVIQLADLPAKAPEPQRELSSAAIFDQELNLIARLDLDPHVAEALRKIPTNWLRVHVVRPSEELDEKGQPRDPGRFVLFELGWIKRGRAEATMFTIDTPDRFEKPMPGRVDRWEGLSHEEQMELLEGMPSMLAHIVKKFAN